MRTTARSFDTTSPRPTTGQRVVDDAVGAHGRLDGLVNNAAVILEARPFLEESPEEFARLLDVNVMGVWLGMQSAGRAMTATGGGSIVNISSTAGMVAHPRLSSYGTSKWAVRGLTKYGAQRAGSDRRPGELGAPRRDDGNDDVPRAPSTARPTSMPSAACPCGRVTDATRRRRRGRVAALRSLAPGHRPRARGRRRRHPRRRLAHPSPRRVHGFAAGCVCRRPPAILRGEYVPRSGRCAIANVTANPTPIVVDKEIGETSGPTTLAYEKEPWEELWERPPGKPWVEVNVHVRTGLGDEADFAGSFAITLKPGQAYELCVFEEDHGPLTTDPIRARVSPSIASGSGPKNATSSRITTKPSAGRGTRARPIPTSRRASWRSA